MIKNDFLSSSEDIKCIVYQSKINVDYFKEKKNTLFLTNERRIKHFYIFNFLMSTSTEKRDFTRQLFVDIHLDFKVTFLLRALKWR